MNQEWLLLHWSKLKTQIFREVAERKAKEAAMQATPANSSANGLQMHQLQVPADQFTHTTNMEIPSSSSYSEASNGQHPTEVDQVALNQYASALLAPPPPPPPPPPAAPKAWTEGERIEAQDRNGDWYRSTVVATSLTGKQVQQTRLTCPGHETHAAHYGIFCVRKHNCMEALGHANMLRKDTTT
jgi:hypothetical protein